MVFIFVLSFGDFSVGGRGFCGNKPDPLRGEEVTLLPFMCFGLGRRLLFTGFRPLTGDRGLGESDRGDKSSSRGESFFGFFFRKLPTSSSRDRPDFGDICPPLVLNLTVLVLLLVVSWLVSKSMLPLIFLLDDMIPTGLSLFVGLLLFKLVRGETPPSRRGTGPVFEKLPPWPTEEVDEIVVIVLDLFPVGRLDLPTPRAGRLGRPRLPVMPGIDIIAGTIS